MDELVKKINLLARKAKEEGLTDEEKAEQQALRAEYIKKFRDSFKKNYLDNMYFVDENGNEVKLKKKK